MVDSLKLIDLKNSADLDKVFDQYKILVESINKSNDMRENSNNFWITVNTLSISALAYIRELENLASNHKTILVWTLISLGFLLCISWLKFLKNIKNSIEDRNYLLIELEKLFPAKPFTYLIYKARRQDGRSSLTATEMLVPGLFLIGYSFFAILMFYVPQAIVK